MSALVDEVKVEAPAPSAAPAKVKRTVKRVVPAQRRNQIPDEILNNSALNAIIDLLPKNYNFEIHKSIWKIKTQKSKRVALQFPEGLLMYACIIADIIEKFCCEIGTKAMILGDVTYGACCVDDFTAQKLGADFLIHYGHSCLVPINMTTIPVMYVFVEIKFDCSHLINMIGTSFPDPAGALCIMGTIQFLSAIHEVSSALRTGSSNFAPYTDVLVPQAKPLSGGETLGCTSPVLPYGTGSRRHQPATVVFIADGRFHLEAVMIRNATPNVAYYRYDPYSKLLTRERYDVEAMRRMRWYGLMIIRLVPCVLTLTYSAWHCLYLCRDAIKTAKNATVFGLILGTLGRQGSTHIFRHLQTMLNKHSMKRGDGAAQRVVIPFLMAELNPAKMASITHVQVWVQVACPRLSIDWGTNSELMHKPLLTPFELQVLLESEDGAAGEQDKTPAEGGRAPVGWTRVKGCGDGDQACCGERSSNAGSCCGDNSATCGTGSCDEPTRTTAAASSPAPGDGMGEEDDHYPMDFYSDNAGPWGNMYHRRQQAKVTKA